MMSTYFYTVLTAFLANIIVAFKDCLTPFTISGLLPLNFSLFDFSTLPSRAFFRMISKIFAPAFGRTKSMIISSMIFCSCLFDNISTIYTLKDDRANKTRITNPGNCQSPTFTGTIFSLETFMISFAIIRRKIFKRFSAIITYFGFFVFHTLRITIMGAKSTCDTRWLKLKDNTTYFTFPFAFFAWVWVILTFKIIGQPNRFAGTRAKSSISERNISGRWNGKRLTADLTNLVNWHKLNNNMKFKKGQ